MDITFALSPFCFSLSSFPNPRAWSSSHVHTTTKDFISCGHLHPWVPPSSSNSIGLSYLVTHLDAKISPTRFHQLSKTKLGLSTFNIRQNLLESDLPLLANTKNGGICWWILFYCQICWRTHNALKYSFLAWMSEKSHEMSFLPLPLSSSSDRSLFFSFHFRG